MSADVDMLGRCLPRRRCVLMVGNAERGVAALQQLQDSIMIPTSMSKLKGVSSRVWQHLNECSQSSFIRGKVGRQLKEDQATFGPQRLQARLHQRDGVLALRA